MHASYILFSFNVTAPTEIYTLSLHDALPICRWLCSAHSQSESRVNRWSRSRSRLPFHNSSCVNTRRRVRRTRSEEHTSELQSRGHLVCRLLLEKKKNV